MRRETIIVVAALFVLLTAGNAGAAPSLPPVPELPSSGYPSVAVAEPFARALLASVEPSQLERLLVASPEAIPAVLRNLGSALMTSDTALHLRLETYASELAAAHAQRLATGSESDPIPLLVTMLLVDPMRSIEDPRFRDRALRVAERSLGPTVPRALRESCLRELNEALGAGFDAAERLAVAWQLASRPSAERSVPFTRGILNVPDDASTPIAASIFSLSSGFFTAEESRRFLAAVRAAAPDRRIVVLGDAPIRAATAGLEIDFVDSFGRPYSPWPRDPFTVATTADGVVFVNRPNEQPDREEDANIVRALVQSLPDAKPWKRARWTVAPAPFHNGHILLTPDTAWISIHTVEIRALQILGISRVPVETFNDPKGIERYLAAVREAAEELEAIYGRTARFVHPLAADPALMRTLGGGAGYDLDSILTLLPRGDSVAAIVGDPSSGARLASGSTWDEVKKRYGIRGDVAAAQKSAAMTALQRFLDLVASHLQANGMQVSRLPLIRISAEMADDAPKDFLLTWNNVVLEPGRAEGFASLLPEGDALAKRVFAELGYPLTLYPPLVRSIVLSGGYRCASNHIR